MVRTASTCTPLPVWPRATREFSLNGYQYNTDGSLGGLQEVKIDRFGTMPAKSTARVDLTLNLNSNQNKTEDADNPYFGLLGLYNAAGKPPLSSDSYAYSQAMTLYDADGKARTVTAYFDGTPDSTAGWAGCQSARFLLPSTEGVKADMPVNRPEASNCRTPLISRPSPSEG